MVFIFFAHFAEVSSSPSASYFELPSIVLLYSNRCGKFWILLVLCESDLTLINVSNVYYFSLLFSETAQLDGRRHGQEIEMQTN